MFLLFLHRIHHLLRSSQAQARTGRLKRSRWAAPHPVDRPGRGWQPQAPIRTSLSLLQAIATAQTGTKKDNKQTKTTAAAKPQKARATAPPQHSKAARRFYNQNIKESPRHASARFSPPPEVIASRRSCEELIFEGKVTVNGSVCNTPQTRVDPAKDVIYVNGSRLPKRQPQKVYLALNKPKGYICSSGENESKSVISLFDDFLKNWGKKHPGVLTPRYIATVDGLVHKRHLIAISEGTTVEGVHCVPDVVELLPHQPEMQRARIRIVVHEGRKHEVRELVKSAGLEIHSLKRVRIGGFRLPPDLGLGKYIELNSTNLNALGWKS
ncbi:hypothetical protein JHK85_057620 [Glycine max]|nr:hypothetical protein JHK86_056607 [Glycine max]KAG4919339.1 hypothetical protein JHK85_057620 [Glycine max]